MDGKLVKKVEIKPLSPIDSVILIGFLALVIIILK
jgi:hypothetical protein